MTAIPSAPSSLLAEVATSALGTDTPPGDPGPLLARVLCPDFTRWRSAAARAGGCSRPIRLRGMSTTINARTGEVIESFDSCDLPDATFYKPCGTRRESVCPACAEVYRWDAYHLIAAGLRGGKGVPDSVCQHPATFVTLTPLSFGVVHTRPDRTGRRGAGRRRLGPCRPRRERPTCPHGRPMFCTVVHGDGDARTGTPLCLDCYDHAAQAAWNAFAPKLWTRTIDAVKRELRRLSRLRGGTPARLRYAKVAEFQARGAIHLHALVRLDGADPNNPDAVLPPPNWATTELLNRLLVDAARSTAVRTPAHPDRPDGLVIQWGQQVRPLTVARGLPGAEVTEQHVAGYLAKYATKATEAAGHVSSRLTESTVRLYADPAKHTGRLIAAAWNLGRPAAGPEWSRLRPWAHMLGFGGHFATKSRNYSTTFGALRAARSVAMRRANASAIAATPKLPPPEDEVETVLVVGSWTYAAPAGAPPPTPPSPWPPPTPPDHDDPPQNPPPNRKETHDGCDRGTHVDAGRRVRVLASPRADALPVAAQGVRSAGSAGRQASPLEPGRRSVLVRGVGALMPRPPLPIGTHGEITLSTSPSGSHVARASYRDFDGVTRPVARTGRTPAIARNKLLTALRDRSTPSGRSGLTAESRFSATAELWLASVQDAADLGDMSPNTAQLYALQLKNHVGPALGALRLREVTTPRVDDFLRVVRTTKGVATAKTCRTVAAGVMRLAVRYGAVTVNPVREAARVRGGRGRTPRALSAAERNRWLAALEADRRAVARDLPDLTRWMLATGLRIGEALAVAWSDVDLETGTVEVDWKLIRITGEGLRRVRRLKGGDDRTLPLPPFAVAMLKRRQPHAGALGPLFPDALGGWRDPSNTSRAFREARDAAGFSWVTSHVFRKTCATILDEAGMSARAIADQLGHARPSMTQDVYMARKVLNPATAAALEAAAGPGRDSTTDA